MADITTETNQLKQLLTDENLKAPDKSGTTPLLAKAKYISELNPLSPEKKFQEDVVCKLVNYFGEFNQVQFSELESYIMVAEFSGYKLLDVFKNYVRSENETEDVVFKACVARTVQHLDRSAFSLEYLKKRFDNLLKLDPWLLSELLIVCNWNEGVKMIKNLLESPNYDASYLFSLLPTWMQEEKNHENISYALSQWYSLFNSNDKKIADYYANNYGYKISAKSERAVQVDLNQSAIEGIIEDKGFVNYKKKESQLNFESLPC